MDRSWGADDDAPGGVAAAETAALTAWLLEHSPQVTFMVSPEGVIRWIAPAVRQLLGWAPPELVGRALVDFLHPYDAAALAEQVALADGGESRTYQARFRTATGLYRRLEATVRPVRDADTGAVTATVGCVRDVTDEVHTQAERESERDRFRAIFRRHDAVMLLIDPATGRIVDGNDAACAFYGYSWYALTELRIGDLNTLPPEQIRDRMEQARRGELNGFVFPHQLADGSIRQVEVHSSPITTADGPLLFSVIHDVTDERLALSALEEAERRYRLVAENASDVVFATSPDGVFTWLSPSVETLLGCAPEDVVGHPAADLVHPDDAGAIAVATPASYEARFRTTDGGFRWLAVSVRAVLDDGGNVLSYVGSGRDITDAVEARRALARSEQQFRLALSSAPIGMAVVSLDRAFLEVNAALAAMLQRGEDWLLSHHVPDILGDGEDESDLALRAELLGGSADHGSRETMLRTGDGRTVIVVHEVALLRDPDGRPLSYVSQFVDVTAERHARAQLAYLAGHDPLTQLPNRRELLAEMTRLLARTPRTGTRLAVLFVDLDGFKEVNDRLGHAAGDAVLVQVAERIRSTLRGDDVLARLGGDEFVIALPAQHGVSDAEDVAAKVIRAVADPFSLAGTTIRLTASVGIAVAEADTGTDPTLLLRQADLALFRGKRGGRNRAATYDAAVDGR